MSDCYGAIGYPLGHTVSPAFQQAAFDELGIDATYMAIETPTSDLSRRMSEVRNGRWAGLNVTIPHKSAIPRFLDGTAETAAAAGAVNTIYWRNGRLLGENTDVPAIGTVLENAEVKKGIRALVVGAGGAARAALLSLTARSDDVVIANRTRSNAEATINAVTPEQEIEILDLNSPSIGKVATECELIVNTTSVGMSGGPAPDESPLPTSALRLGQVVFDVVYRPEVTPLLAQAAEAGCRTIGGLEMLVIQGALSFELWTGKPAPLDTMMRAARTALATDSG
ncbi:MAG: shikimate dehydrogenase [Chloroflexi bacterium]|nr:shikimate dehydrogenase [Chloroflexota bacterium]